MSTITFGGLATGLDTAALVEELMAVERQPITLLENDKAWLNSRLKALQEFDDKLSSFLTTIEELGSGDGVSARQASQTSEAYFSASASADALLANYQVEVVSLAQVQKDVSQGYADSSLQEFGTGSLTLTVGENAPVTVEITAENNSLAGIVSAINNAGAGVTASIINDGTETPYRLVLTADDVASEFVLDSSGLLGGTYAAPVMVNTQAASQAHIRVDNVDIYRDSNSVTQAIPGVSLDLLAAEEGVTTGVGISLDKTTIKERVNSFVTAYNEVMSFVRSSSDGPLGYDSGVNTIKRRLQSMIAQQIPNSGNFTSLSQLGFETQRDGSLILNNSVLSDAIDNDFESFENLFAGEGEVQGILEQFTNYLDSLTDFSDGFLAGRKESIDSNIARIDQRIETTERRLEKREQNLLNQFNALELLVSQMNATSSYLTKQLESLEKMWDFNKD